MRDSKAFRRSLRRIMKAWAAPIGCGLLFLFLLRFIFFVGYVPSASMEPAIKEGSFIWGVRTFGKLARGDIIIFKHGSALLVKRIAGVPGDTVIADGQSMIVPPDCYFVLGDNAEQSLDSRSWADPFIAADSIVAKL